MTDILSDFVQFVDNGADSELQVDIDGLDNGVAFTQIALIQGLNGLDAATLEASSNLVI